MPHPLSRPPLIAPLLLAAALLAPSPAVAQLQAPSPDDAQPPVELPEPTAPEDPVVVPYAEKAWTLHVQIEGNDLLREIFLQTQDNRVARLTRGRPFSFDRAVVVFPLIEGTATSWLRTSRVTSELTFDNEVADDQPALLPGYQAGERLGRWDATDVREARVMRLAVDLPVRAWKTDFDEARAAQVPWPEGPWPAICASALQPQLAVDPGAPEVVAFVERALGDEKPWDLTPVALAKRLAFSVIDRFQPTGLGAEFDPIGRYAGFEVNGSVAAAKELRGTDFDMAALLCAAYRSAGLPARLVVAYNLVGSPELADENKDDLTAVCGRRFTEGDFNLPMFHAWVEFALFDEQANTLEWVPVDVVRQRGISSRPRPLDQAWTFFGSNPCSDYLLPISHHFFPPTTVFGAGAPMFWGWIALPDLPLITQTLRINANATPRSPDGYQPSGRTDDPD